MDDLYRLAGPFIRLLDPEMVHGLAISALKTGLVWAQPTFEDPVLEQTLWGQDFANPVGLAAGFDKNAEVVDAMLGQGFGFVEIGSVTPRPQTGNPGPRLFRLPAEEAVINRLGFNNDGLEVVANRLEKRTPIGILGINLGKNVDSVESNADYAQGITRLAAFADYLVVNVSSPNTPGLRALQRQELLRALLDVALEARARAVHKNPPPLLLKIAPDLTDKEKCDIANVALGTGIDGLIATNTTIDRPKGLTNESASQSGGLSGKPLLKPSTRVLSQMYQLTGGKIPLIGVGGISNGADAYAKIRAGASLVQFYSAMVYHGLGLVQDIKRELAALIKADGFTSISQAIGADQKKPIVKT